MTQVRLTSQPATPSHSGQAISAPPLSHSISMAMASTPTSMRRLSRWRMPARLVHSQPASSTTAAVKRAKKPPDRPNRPASISGASQAAVMMRCLSTLSLDLFIGHAEATLAALEVGQRLVEGLGIEIGPQQWREVELGIGQLPEDEVGDALLAAGADAEIHRRHPGQAQLAGEGGLVDGVGRELAGRHPLTQAACRPGQVPLAAVVGGDDQVQAGVVAGLLLGPGGMLLGRVRGSRGIAGHPEAQAVGVALVYLPP